jgi:hypothetical protein
VFRLTLNEQAVKVDNFSAMNAGLAKAPFTEKTISEIISHAASVVGVKLNYEDKTCSGGERLKRMLVESKQKSSECVTTENATKAKCAITISRSNLAYLQFCVAVHRIYYHQRFINSRWKLTRDNIESEEAEQKDALKYFEDWRIAALLYMNDDPSVTTRDRSRRFCLSPKTYKNMRFSVCGFVTYAKKRLSYNDSGLWYVPSMHSNTSALESRFSLAK